MRRRDTRAGITSRVYAGTAVLLLALAPAGAGATAIEGRRLEKTLDELRPHLVRATGLSWPESLPIETIDRAGMEALLLAEARQEVAILDPDRPEAARELHAKMLARAMARVVRAKYGLATKKIHVATSALERLPEGLDPDRVLALLVAHEAVHALDDHRFDLGRLIRGAEKPEALRALRMVIEGRAEYFGERAAAHVGVPAAVGRALARNRDLGERIVRDAGRKFVAAVLDRDGAEEMLSRPPATTTHVFHPERYLAGTPLPDAAAPLRAAKIGEWARRIETVSELTFRKLAATRLPASEVSGMFAGYLAGAAATGADGTQLTLTEHGSEKGARAFLAGLMAFEGQGAGPDTDYGEGPLSSPDGRKLRWWVWRRGVRVLHLSGPEKLDPLEFLGPALGPLPPEKTGEGR